MMKRVKGLERRIETPRTWWLTIAYRASAIAPVSTLILIGIYKVVQDTSGSIGSAVAAVLGFAIPLIALWLWVESRTFKPADAEDSEDIECLAALDPAITRAIRQWKEQLPGGVLRRNEIERVRLYLVGNPQLLERLKDELAAIEASNEELAKHSTLEA
jgi:hypothetical protein